MARSYLPSKVSEIVALWRKDLNKVSCHSCVFVSHRIAWVSGPSAMILLFLYSTCIQLCEFNFLHPVEGCFD